MSTPQTSSTRPLSRVLMVVWMLAVLGALYWAYREFWRDPVDYYNRAVQLRDTGRPAEALEQIQRAVKNDPGNVGFLLTQAYLQEEMGQAPEALASFEAALAKDPRNAEVRFGMAKALAAARRNSEAVGALLGIDAAKLTPAERLRRARALAGLGAQTNALADFEVALKTGGGDPALLLDVAGMANSLQRFELAADLFQRVLENTAATNRHAAARAGLATSLRAMGKPEEAYRLFLTVAGPQNLQARAELALQLQQFGDAETNYIALLAREPENLTNTLALARIYEMTQRYGKALPLLQEATNRMGQAGAELGLRIGNLSRWAGRPADALASYERFLQSSPTNAALAREARLGQVQAALDLRQGAAALDYAKPLLAETPRDPELLLLAARGASLAQDAARTVDYLKQLAAARALTPEEMVWLAGQYRAAGQKQNALETYESVLRAAPDQRDPAVLEALGDLRADFGDTAGALDAYHAIAPGARAPGIHLKIARLADTRSAYDIAQSAYTNYLAAFPDDLEARLALAMLYQKQGQGEPAAAMGGEVITRVDAALGQAPDDPRLLLAGARAAALLKDTPRMVGYLDALRKTPAQDPALRLTVAGLYRQAGEKPKALETYIDIWRDTPAAADAAVFEAIGDLRADLGDLAGAVEAYQVIAPKDRTPRLALKQARVLQQQKQHESAQVVALYREYLAANPQDAEIKLEAARFFVNVGERDESLRLYREVVEARGNSQGLNLEIARACLMAERFDEAEKWSRLAVEEDSQDWRAQLVLAQSLHLQGKRNEADDLIDQQRDKLMQDPEGMEWIAMVAMARDRHLEAYRIFDRLADGEETTRVKYWLWRGQAAQRLEDYGRAAGSFEAAGQLQGGKSLAEILGPPRPKTMGVQISLDAVYDPSPVSALANVSNLVELLAEYGITRVYVDGCADEDRDGAAEAAYFANRVLPVRMPLLKPAAEALKARGIEVYVGMPVLGVELARQDQYTELRVRERRLAYRQSSLRDCKRLSPFHPDAQVLMAQVYEDLATNVPLQGVVFQEDAFLADTEDFNVAALPRLRTLFGTDKVSADTLSGERAERWAAEKTERLTAFTEMLMAAVRSVQPQARFVRTLYSPTLTDPGSTQRLAQDFADALKRYDQVLVLAYPEYEDPMRAAPWLRKLAELASAQPDAADKVIFRLRAYNSLDNDWVTRRELIARIRALAAGGARHVAYDPADLSRDGSYLDNASAEVMGKAWR